MTTKTLHMLPDFLEHVNWQPRNYIYPMCLHTETTGVVMAIIFNVYKIWYGEWKPQLIFIVICFLYCYNGCANTGFWTVNCYFSKVPSYMLKILRKACLPRFLKTNNLSNAYSNKANNLHFSITTVEKHLDLYLMFCSESRKVVSKL